MYASAHSLTTEAKEPETWTFKGREGSAQTGETRKTARIAEASQRATRSILLSGKVPRVIKGSNGASFALNPIRRLVNDKHPRRKEGQKTRREEYPDKKKVNGNNI